MEDHDLDAWTSATRKLLAKLPPSHQVVLKRLFEFLAEVASHEEVNSMGSENLGTVFAPNILTLKDDAPLAQILATTPSCVAFTAKCIEHVQQLF